MPSVAARVEHLALRGDSTAWNHRVRSLRIKPNVANRILESRMHDRHSLRCTIDGAGSAHTGHFDEISSDESFVINLAHACVAEKDLFPRSEGPSTQCEPTRSPEKH